MADCKLRSRIDLARPTIRIGGMIGSSIHGEAALSPIAFGSVECSKDEFGKPKLHGFYVQPEVEGFANYSIPGQDRATVGVGGRLMVNYIPSDFFVPVGIGVGASKIWELTPGNREGVKVSGAIEFGAGRVYPLSVRVDIGGQTGIDGQTRPFFNLSINATF